MSNRMFKFLMIGVGVVIAACVAIIVCYSALSSGNGSNSAEKQGDPAAKIDTKTIKALSADQIWSKAAFIGNEKAEHKLVVYSDLFCPYCRKAFEAIKQNMDDFKGAFIDNNKLSYELRITDGLTNPSDPDESYISTIGGEVVQCAALQNHFWDYLGATEDKIYEDYYSKGLGDRHRDKATEPDWRQHQIKRMGTDYFTDIAKTVDGMDMDKLNTCISSGEGMKKLKQYTISATKVGIHSFPDFFVDGKEDKSLYSIDNSYDYDKFYKGIKLGLQAKGL